MTSDDDHVVRDGYAGQTSVDEFKHVFPGATEAGFKAAADEIKLHLDGDLNPVGVPALGDVERLLDKVQTTHDPSAALLAYGLAVGMLPGGRDHAAYSRYLCEAAYECQTVLQEKQEKRLHKGHTLHHLGLIYSSLGDPEGAFRWFALAHIEDCVSNTDSLGRKNGMAFGVLRTRYGVRAEEFTKLWKAIDDLIAKATKTDQENLAMRYPEALYLLTWLEAGAVAPLARTTTEFPNWPLLKDLLGILKKTKDSDGKLAEFWLALYFFGAPCFEIRTNVWTTTREYEFDVLVASGLDHTHLASNLGTYFAGEAKDWDHKVGASAVNHFASKLMFHGMSLGVLLAKNNVSGAELTAYQNARKTLLKLAQSKGVYVVIWDKDDLHRFVEQRRGPIAALRATYEEARFELTGQP